MCTPVRPRPAATAAGPRRPQHRLADRMPTRSRLARFAGSGQPTGPTRRQPRVASVRRATRRTQSARRRARSDSRDEVRAPRRAGRRPGRVVAPSFVSTAATWCSAVRGDTTSRSAISAFVSPSASSASTSSWRAVSPAGLARVASRGPCGNAQPELAQAPRDAPRQRLGAEPAGDLDRLDQRLLVVEQREHQRPVVGPAHLAEGIGRAAPVAPEHRRVRRRRGGSSSTGDPGDGRPCRHAHRAPADQARRAAATSSSELLEPLGRHRRAGRQRPLGRQLERPARRAAARPCDRPAPRDRPAARRRPRRRGGRPARRAPSWRAAGRR